MKRMSKVFVIGAVLALMETCFGAQPSLTATVQSTKRLSDGTTSTISAMFYRDTRGRTRLESSNMVQIFDLLAGMAITLDLDKKIAYVYSGQSAANASTQPSVPKSNTSNGKVLKPYVDQITDLGTEVINGYTVHGQRHTSEHPPGTGMGIRFTRVTTERWHSQDLSLSLLIKITDSRGEQVTTTYTDIVTGVPVDSSLFSVPSGFQVVDVGSAATN